MTEKILVTGALGNVGAEVVNSLVRLGAGVRAADLNPQAIEARFGKQVESRRLDFSDPSSFAPAVEGAQALFLMRPPQISDVQRLIFPFIDAAQAAGVKQVSFLSLIGIENNRRVPHYKIEQRLRVSQMTWCFLRASFFMQNLSTTHRQEIQQRNEIDVPVGRGKTSFIDVRDLGAVAALTLTQPGHAGQAYDLTGPDALDYYQVAEIFSQELGRNITYRNPSAIQFLVKSIRNGIPTGYALIMTWLYTQTRKGMSAQVTGETARLLGRPPVTLRQYVQDYRALWSDGKQQ